MPEKSATTCRPARLRDVPLIQQIINRFASDGEMLSRTLNELYENVRDFLVCEIGGEVAGCVALHLVWHDLAEIKSLAVDEKFQGRGAGTLLVRAALDDARRLEAPSVFALTFRPTFFERLGFRRIDKHDLPQKIWGECVRCAKFPDCNEQAMIIDLAEKR